MPDQLGPTELLSKPANNQEKREKRTKKSARKTKERPPKLWDRAVTKTWGAYVAMIGRLLFRDRSIPAGIAELASFFVCRSDQVTVITGKTNEYNGPIRNKSERRAFGGSKPIR